MTDTFTLSGITWRRSWIGDNSGRYEWTSDDGRLICFRDGREYSATLDGYASTKTWLTLTAAMAATHGARDKLDRRGT
jgi:hypothetical protein